MIDIGLRSFEAVLGSNARGFSGLGHLGWDVLTTTATTELEA